MFIEEMKLWPDREDVKLTTFLTMPDKFIPNPEKKPAVIVCPGGAYMSCPRHGAEGDPVAMSFAADGYQSFVLEYSVSENAPEGKALFPAQLIDFGKAFLMIRDHAEEWCVDVNRISIIGFSAGAHLCGMYATTWHEKLLSETFGVEAEVFKPLSAMLLYGIFDYRVQGEFRKGGNVPFLPNNLNKPIFGEIDPPLVQLEQYSPICHLSENTPPIFMAAAVDDGLVPSIQSVLMAKALHEKKISYELHMFEYGDHGFSLGRNLFEAYREDKAHACAKWMPMAKTFLLHKVAPETAECEKNPFADLDLPMLEMK